MKTVARENPSSFSTEDAGFDGRPISAIITFRTKQGADDARKKLVFNKNPFKIVREVKRRPEQMILRMPFLGCCLRELDALSNELKSLVFVENPIFVRPKKYVVLRFAKDNSTNFGITLTDHINWEIALLFIKSAGDSLILVEKREAERCIVVEYPRWDESESLDTLIRIARPRSLIITSNIPA